MKRKILSAWLLLALAFGRCLASPVRAGDAAVTLENEHWRVVVQPRWGGRASSMVSLADGYDFVSHWGEVRTRRTGEEWRGGGVFRGMMSGTYNSSQPEEPYALTGRSATGVSLAYENRHPLLEGLREERSISLSGRDVVLSVRVTNRGSGERVMYYRFHDGLGVGARQGKDSVHVIPVRAGNRYAFTSNPGEPVNRHFVAPAENWYALADLVNGRGLLVRGAADFASIYFFGSGRMPFDPYFRNSEIFFPQVKLAPGESWETTLRFTAFAPDGPETGDERLDRALAAPAIEGYLAEGEGRIQRALLPFNAEMSLSAAVPDLRITPVHPAAPVLGGAIALDYGRTLERIHLSGTPGEVVAFAFAVTAGTALERGEVSFSDLRSRWRRRIAADAFEPRFVAGESQLLVRDWHLSRNIPLDRISHVNNDVADAEALTPFSLAAGETAWVWVRLRIPGNAAAGEYRAFCAVDAGEPGRGGFEIALRVRPFRLIEAGHKTYGTFFDYHVRPPDGGEMWEAGRNAPYALSREDYFAAMKVFRDIGVNGLVTYVARRDDLLWVLDRAVELGMNGDHVLIVPYGVKAEDLAARNITAYGWTVDEPGSYAQIPVVVERYERVLEHGLKPIFTPNVPVGLLITDHLKEIVPIINTNGNTPYLAAATRRYRDEGRRVFWYECDGLGPLDRPLERRALRGIYLWKEPVDGIFDWDHSSNRPNLSIHHLAGFAGTEILPRLGLENIRQGLTDLHYLHTLETLAGRTRDQALRAEAEQFMGWVRRRFDTDYHDALLYLEDPQYLDEVRGRAAGLIEKLAGR